jgi:hypothetical protein
MGYHTDNINFRRVSFSFDSIPFDNNKSFAYTDGITSNYIDY